MPTPVVATSTPVPLVAATPNSFLAILSNPAVMRYAIPGAIVGVGIIVGLLALFL
jgi:hypothetical protein